MIIRNKLIYPAILFHAIFFCACHKPLQQTAKNIIVTGKVEGFRQGDTVKLRLWKYTVSYAGRKSLVPHETYLNASSDGSFSFTVPVHDEEVRYMKLTSENKLTSDNDKVTLSLHRYLVFPADSINIKIVRDSVRLDGAVVSNNLRVDTILFSGDASSLFACQYAIRKANSKYKLPDSLRALYKNRYLLVQGKKCYGLKSISYWSQRFNGITQLKLAVLDAYHSKISEKAFSILKNGIISANALAKQETFAISLSNIGSHLESKEFNAAGMKLLKHERQKVIERYRNVRTSLIPNTDGKFLVESLDYPDYILKSIKFNCRYIDTSISPLDQIINSYDGRLREILITKYFLEYGRSLPHKKVLLEKGRRYIETPGIVKALDRFFSATKTGQLAYDFELEDVTGKRHSLSDYYGKAVFIDFWFEGCGGCKQYYQKELSKVEEIFNGDTSVVFISISIDRKREEFLRGVKSGNYTTPHQENVINLNTGPLGSFHPVIKNYQVMSYPWPMLINKKRMIVMEGHLLRTKENLTRHIRQLL